MLYSPSSFVYDSYINPLIKRDVNVDEFLGKLKTSSYIPGVVFLQGFTSDFFTYGPLHNNSNNASFFMLPNELFRI